MKLFKDYQWHIKNKTYINQIDHEHTSEWTLLDENKGVGLRLFSYHDNVEYGEKFAIKDDNDIILYSFDRDEFLPHNLFDTICIIKNNGGW